MRFRPDPEPPREPTWRGAPVRCHRPAPSVRVTYAPCYVARIPAMAGFPPPGVAIEAPVHREYCLAYQTTTCPCGGVTVLRVLAILLDREGAAECVERHAQWVRRNGAATEKSVT